jgi:hypothetical protein
MSDTTTALDQLSTGQANIPLRINELLDAASPATLFGRRAATTVNLVWGYYGGRWGGLAIANGTLTLADAATSHITVHRSSGVVSASTATTNWDNTADHARAYKVTTAGGLITAWEDHRAGINGTATAGGSGGGGGGMTNPMTGAGDLIRGGTGGAPTRLAPGTNGHILTLVGGVPTWAANAGAGSPTVSIPVAVGDETTALTAGTGKVTFRMPHGFTLSGVRASLTTAQTSGAVVTVDINTGGASILSTKLTIDNTEKSSTTASVPAVISTSTLADDAEITIDVDQVGGATAKGLKVYLIGVVS